MDESLAQWLALREPIDHAVRSPACAAIVSTVRQMDTVRVLDLATGSGSNLRYLVPRLQRRQDWLVVDRSATLLGELTDRTRRWAASRGHVVVTDHAGFSIAGAGVECRVETRQLDLGALNDAGMFADRHVVTTSALLDLVSEQWLQTLARRCRDVGAAVLFGITYNGRSVCDPRDSEDDLILALFNRHQQTDKGLGGVAVGPAAVACATSCFRNAGYQITCEPSDWRLGPREAELQRQLIAGWAAAASEVAPHHARSIERWLARRLEHVEAGRSHVVVGHDDVAARLPTVDGGDEG